MSGLAAEVASSGELALDTWVRALALVVTFFAAVETPAGVLLRLWAVPGEVTVGATAERGVSNAPVHTGGINSLAAATVVGMLADVLLAELVVEAWASATARTPAVTRGSAGVSGEAALVGDRCVASVCEPAIE